MRYREVGTLPDPYPTGPRNLITDVPGLRVGHHTLQSTAPLIHSGVTVIDIPQVETRPVSAAAHVFNGYGKSMGLVQVEELGTIESPIYLTNTLGIGAVQQGAVQAALRRNPALRSFNAMVMECNDSHLSDIATLPVTPAMALAALDAAAPDFAQGSVGAGTGMVCFGHKGGIGSNSRRVTVAGRPFNIGTLVLSNFGRAEDLTLPGLDLRLGGSEPDGRGSLILILATDIPLMPHQLKRVARHMSMAIGVLGAPGHHGSGDIALAFSTGLRFGGDEGLRSSEVLLNDGEAMSVLFRAAVWSCAESILDSMMLSPRTVGLRGTVPSLATAIRHQLDNDIPF